MIFQKGSPKKFANFACKNTFKSKQKYQSDQIQNTNTINSTTP